MPIRTLPLLLLIALSAAGSAIAQTTGPKNPPLVIPSMSGRDLFEFYCATCHGRDGRGNGPVTAALKTVPPDLTGLAARAGGTFPKARIEHFVTVDGGLPPIAAHGTAQMPVWGPVFRGLDPSDTAARIRIANVVEYLESLQQKPQVIR